MSIFYLVLFFNIPLAFAKQFRVHFDSQKININLPHSCSCYDVLVSMIARGHGHGNLFSDPTGTDKIPLSTPLIDVNSNIWFKPNPSIRPSQPAPSRIFKVFGVNGNKLKKKFAYFNRMLIHHDYDIIFLVKPVSKKLVVLDHKLCQFQ